MISFANAKPFLKRLTFIALAAQPMLNHRLHKLTMSEGLTILNLHRVDDKKGSAYEAMHPDVFDELIGWLKKHFRIITFADLKRLKKSQKPLLILSFDDGYKDYIEIVAPILHKHGVMANQNIIPACVESGYPPMNVMLQDFIGTAPATLLRDIKLPEFEGIINPDARIKSGILASAVLKNKPIHEQKILFKKLEEYFMRFDRFQTTRVMNIEDIKQLLANHEIGVHSFEHATMTAESDDYLRRDVSHCSQWFEKTFECKTSIYAFPNGAANKNQLKITHNHGYNTVLMVGELFSQTKATCHSRFTMYAKTLPEARFRALGGRSPINSK